LLDVGKACGNAAVNWRTQSSGRNHPQNVAVPAWGLRRWSVNWIAIAWPPDLNSNGGATVW
jgi:hypothetical protein